MKNSIRNINRLYNVAYSSIFTINGRLSYDRVTDCLIKLADMLAETETDEFVFQEIGENNEACLADLIIGAFWHYTEWHGGQDSKEYAALSSLGCIFSPGMESGPQPESGENDAYTMLNNMAMVTNARIFDSGPDYMDRYTAFPFLNSDKIRERVMFIGFAPGGFGISQWGEVKPGDLNNLSFLGEEIGFYDLPKESQHHLYLRICDGEE